jgi:PAS domain S-box-containing protein
MPDPARVEPAERGGDPPCWAHLFGDEDEPIRDEVLARLVRDLADAVIICDPDGIIVFWNTAATRLFGWPADQVVGTSLDVIIPERLRARHWHGYHDVMATGRTSYGERLLEVPALHRDGRTLSIAFTVSLLRLAADGPVTGIAALIRDDTERWQERRRLGQTLEQLRQSSSPT